MLFHTIKRFIRNNRQIILVLIEYFVIVLIIGFLLLIAYMMQNPTQ